ncbi:XcbB/CpsF family capsular polysaccharide biosynthesis protein [Glutamicibacter sp. FBE19]|uniref:XcbB/CpsF family capsular polysaccharide biosynthesis protein n=1 Tax=Glutamicibacter sp. FBE19 TaxID=2761534 RepID=UPI0018965573|nr:XcbB/CpsF family capsular polysaccharide biosynthesis protein [Glutamicibacter sp. FBE19]MBF6671412.1 XcbB/CpsF family capsular polysaccharide biosynthesis protein [Glutamicibacter sp. FBE19]
MERTGNVLKLDSPEVRDLVELLNSDSTLKYIHVDTATMNLDQTFSRIALTNEEMRQGLVTLARHGYYSYVQRETITSFVHESRVSALWNPLKDGTYSKTDDGIVYSIEKPQQNPGRPRLLVLFSSMPPYLFTSSLSRYFTKNYNSISKFSNKETYVLRIADLGGVIGNFYLDTLTHPNNSKNIEKLITSIMKQYGIDAGDAVLLGSSKGGTGATFYGVSLGLKFVAVDPILSDEHYWNNHNDIHFTNNEIFSSKKSDIFSRLFADDKLEKSPEGTQCVIYSSRSPQHKYIDERILSNTDNGIFIDVDNPDIHDHPDVSPNSIHVTTSIVSTMLAGISLKNGRSVVK